MGMGAFEYDAASDTFKPATLATSRRRERRQVRVRVPHDREDRDYVFTDYGKR
jgi:hypothetical protein